MRLQVSFLLLSVVAVGRGGGPEPAAKPITDAKTVLAIYTSGGFRPSVEPQLILAIWGDGRVVWSEDRLQGGSPYRAGQIEAKRLTALVSRLEHDGVFADEKLSHANFGPGSQFTTILVKLGKQQLKMQSWHELYEADSKVVATKRGLAPLDGRSRQAVLAEQPAEYLHYRLVWGELRESASSLIPSESKLINGKLLLDAGNVSWQELPGKAEKPVTDKK